MREVRDWWLGIAKSLPVGTSTKVRHPNDTLGKTPSVTIYNSSVQYGAKCFRRGISDSVKKQYINLAEILSSKEESSRSTLPDDIRSYNPYGLSLDTETLLANSYLIKRGLNPHELYDFGLQLSKSRMRLIFWGFDTAGNQGGIGRDITEEHSAKSVNYYSNGVKLCDLVLTTQTSGATILVEDINSAMKLALTINKSVDLGSEVISLNGTKINPNCVLHCMDKDVIIWLDGDQAGVKGALDCYKELLPFARSLVIIQGSGDPKDYLEHEIQTILEASHPCNPQVQKLIQIEEVLI